jgi:hypothetical protein
VGVIGRRIAPFLSEIVEEIEAFRQFFEGIAQHGGAQEAMVRQRLVVAQDMGAAPEECRLRPGVDDGGERGLRAVPLGIVVGERKPAPDPVQQAALGKNRAVEEKELLSEVAVGRKAPVNGEAGFRLAHFDVHELRQVGDHVGGNEKAADSGHMIARVDDVPPDHRPVDLDVCPAGNNHRDSRRHGRIVRRQPASDGVATVNIDGKSHSCSREGPRAPGTLAQLKLFENGLKSLRRPASAELRSRGRADGTAWRESWPAAGPDCRG